MDPAEVLWEAASVPPRRRPVLVWGYPRLGRDELAFVDALAEDGSSVHLPHADDALFSENLETAEALRRRAWTVNHAPVQAVWEVGARVEAN